MLQLDEAARILQPLAPTAGRRLLIKGGVIISMDETVGDLAAGDILIEDERITDIGPSLSADDAEVIDARGMIVSPGFVDGHRHAWEAQLRHLNPNSDNLMDYCCATHFSFAPHYRPLDIYIGTLMTAIGGIDAGVTTIIDNCHNARTNDHAAASIAAWLDSGVRALCAPGPPSVGEWDDAGWPGPRLTYLKDKLAAANSHLVTLGAMAQFIPEVWAAARALGLPIITEAFSPDMAGVILDLHQRGQLGPDNIFNHITGFPDGVLRILTAAGVRVNVCPRSDAQYGAGDGGAGTFQAALLAGLDPAFSIDNETSYSADMFGEMRAELFLQRASTQRDRSTGKADVPPPVTIRQVLRAATLSGARCASLDHITGSLSPGKAADLIMIRATDINLHPLNNALGAVVQGADRGNIDTVIIGGRIRKRAGQIVGLDAERLKALATESRDRLMAAVGYTHRSLFCERHTALAVEAPALNRYWL